MVAILERFKEGIEVEHSENATKEEKNQNRLQAIKERISQETTIKKRQFIDFLERSDRPQETIQQMKQSIQDIDFSNANPRNNGFINELAFAGESMLEAFYEDFGIERDKAVERYTDQLQVIEERKEAKADSRFYIGGFTDGKLKRFTEKKEDKKQLQSYIDNQRERQQNKKEAKSIERTLDQKQEKEE